MGHNAITWSTWRARSATLSASDTVHLPHRPGPPGRCPPAAPSTEERPRCTALAGHRPARWRRADRRCSRIGRALPRAWGPFVETRLKPHLRTADVGHGGLRVRPPEEQGWSDRTQATERGTHRRQPRTG